jgi:hypothetical protein
MLRFGKRLGVELVWLLGACALGAYVWIMIASRYENSVDTYWTANGHPPAVGMYRAPREWRFVIMLAPYLIRIVWLGARRLRPASS